MCSAWTYLQAQGRLFEQPGVVDDAGRLARKEAKEPDIGLGYPTLVGRDLPDAEHPEKLSRVEHRDGELEALLPISAQGGGRLCVDCNRLAPLGGLSDDPLAQRDPAGRSGRIPLRDRHLQLPVLMEVEKHSRTGGVQERRCSIDDRLEERGEIAVLRKIPHGLVEGSELVGGAHRPFEESSPLDGVGCHVSDRLEAPQIALGKLIASPDPHRPEHLALRDERDADDRSQCQERLG